MRTSLAWLIKGALPSPVPMGFFLATLVALPSSVIAQSQVQFLQVPSAQEANARAAAVPTPAPSAPLLPWQRPNPVEGNGLPSLEPLQHSNSFGMPRITPPGQQAMPQALPTRTRPSQGAPLPSASPFGQSIANQYQPIPSGSPTLSAVPVESIDAVAASEPAPAEPNAAMPDPASEDPSEPTELTAPIFAKPTEGQPPSAPQQAMVQVLNKVTARAESFLIPPNRMLLSGNIQIWVSQCQHSTPTSLPDAAALFQISETIEGQAIPKPIFHGWLYQSSPSVSALEHPIYDVTLLGCRPLATPAPVTKKKN